MVLKLMKCSVEFSTPYFWIIVLSNSFPAHLTLDSNSSH
jgi:hypothetical protein